MPDSVTGGDEGGQLPVLWRGAAISVTDEIVVALAAEHAQSLILTSDPGELAALAAHCESEIRFAPM